MRQHAKAVSRHTLPFTFSTAVRRPLEVDVRKTSIEVPLEPGRPASVAWCHKHLSWLRGYEETTPLPVGMGIASLKYGLAQYADIASTGLPIRNPIAFVIGKAQQVHLGRVQTYVPIEREFTFH